MLKNKLKIIILLLRLVVLFNFLAFFLKPAVWAAGANYQQLTPLQKDYWLKLLHYYQGKSKADGEYFFLAKNGKFDPGDELEETIKAFKDPKAVAGWFHYHPQCVFRERYRFLKQLGFLKMVEENSCLEFKAWKEGLNADSITLVFSSSYPNNPSSLFGHTLIRLNQRLNQNEKKNDLLDYAVAFSAMPEKDDIGVVFAFKGMFGGYKGLLEVTKYYVKVNEYNNGESRDLMEYDLAMTTEELDRLINHLWEIYQTTYFYYYFVDENCSSVLADILAVPFNLDKIDQHQRWYYLPSEMIKAFKKVPGRIKSEHYRPSLKKQLEKKFNQLSLSELKEVGEINAGKKTISNQDSIYILDGVTSLLDFTRNRTKTIFSKEEETLFRTALLMRSKKGVDLNHQNFQYPENNRPEYGHQPQKFSLYSKIENKEKLFGIEIKQGYHDLLSDDRGFDPFSQFDFLKAALIYNKNLKKFSYDHLILVDLISLHPYLFFDPQFSWAARVGLDRQYDLQCELCHKLDARAYLGPSFKPHEEMILSFMTGPFLEVFDPSAIIYRLGIGLEASFYYLMTEKIKWGILDEWRVDISKKMRKDFYHRLSFKAAYFLSKNQELRFENTFVSRFQSWKKKVSFFQLNYGFYY